MLQYGVRKIVIAKSRQPGLYGYLDAASRKAKLLRNAALFRIRNNFTGRKKDHPTPCEQEVLDEVSAAVSTGMEQPKSVLSYSQLDRIMRVNRNPDYFAGLPMQSAQQILKQACHDFKGWLSALRIYKDDPSGFTGRPRMPGYVKSDRAMVKFTNQDCVMRLQEDGTCCMKLPLTKLTVPCGKLPDSFRLKEVQCSPESYGFTLFLIYETDLPDVHSDMPYTAAIDFGADNLASIVSNVPGLACVIYKGGAVKSANQWFNKCMADLRSIRMKGHDPETFYPAITKRMSALSCNREMFLADYFHKAAKHIILWCVRNRIGTLVIGRNPLWKQGSSIGRKSNQSFVQIPFYRFQQMLRYLCGRNGIRYIEQEESYTSKASAVDGDIIPVYRKDNTDTYQFSGSRIKRGLYRTKAGLYVNADLNGAANIGRKADPDMFAGLILKSILRNINVVRFSDLYIPKRNGPIPRTEAA